MGIGLGGYLANPQASRLQVVRAAAALPAAGAYDDTPAEVVCLGMDYAMFYMRYTRGGAGGDMQFQVEISPYVVDADAPAGHPAWCRATVFAAGAVVSGADTLSNLQRDASEYGSVAVDAEDFVYGALELLGGAERIRVPCRESGVVGTPGTCGVVVLFSVRGG